MLTYAMQVRRGDSCLHAAMSASRPLCIPASTYFENVVEIVARYGGGDGVGGVMLATDSDEVLTYADVC